MSFDLTVAAFYEIGHRQISPNTAVVLWALAYHGLSDATHSDGEHGHSVEVAYRAIEKHGLTSAAAIALGVIALCQDEGLSTLPEDTIGAFLQGNQARTRRALRELRKKGLITASNELLL